MKVIKNKLGSKIREMNLSKILGEKALNKLDQLEESHNEKDST